MDPHRASGRPRTQAPPGPRFPAHSNLWMCNRNNNKKITSISQRAAFRTSAGSCLVPGEPSVSLEIDALQVLNRDPYPYTSTRCPNDRNWSKFGVHKICPITTANLPFTCGQLQILGENYRPRRGGMPAMGSVGS